MLRYHEYWEFCTIENPEISAFLGVIYFVVIGERMLLLFKNKQFVVWAAHS
jgi:hypothetical protein